MKVREKKEDSQEREREEIKREKVFVQLVISSCWQTNQPVEKDKPQVFHILFPDKPVP